MTKDNFQVYFAKKEDLETIYLIERESIKTFWTKKSIECEFSNPNYTYFVLKDKLENKVIGYIGFWKILDEIEIGNIAIDDEYRGQSLGYLLIEEVFDFAKKNKVKNIFLEVREGNKRAIKFYKNNGFLFLRKRKAYYSDNGEDALVMIRSLN